MQLRFKKSFHYVGTALALLGIVFVARRICVQGIGVDTTRLDMRAYSWVAAAAVLYAASNLMLGMGWLHLLFGLRATTTRAWALRTHAMSQLAKYVPGNVAHLASRQALGMSNGVAGWTLARSSAWELGLLCVSGATLSALAMPMHLEGVSPLTGLALGMLGAGIVGVALQLGAGTHFALAFLWQLAFLGLSGSIFAGLFGLTAPAAAEMVPWLGVLGAFVGAWLIGLITPGAPAGLGVRELAFLALVPLGNDQGNALLALVLMRLVTMSGDFLIFIVASMARSESQDI